MALTIAGAAAIGGIGLPLHKVEPWQFVCAYQHGQGNLVSLFAGKSDPLVTVSLEGRTGQIPASVLANDPMWKGCWEDIETKAIVGSLLGGMLGFGLCFGLAIWMRDQGRKAGLDKFVAGTRIVTERTLRNLTKRGTDERSLAHRHGRHSAMARMPPLRDCRDDRIGQDHGAAPDARQGRGARRTGAGL